MTTYTEFVSQCRRGQISYIADEEDRMRRARELYETFRAGMKAIGLHPLTIDEILSRQRELRSMLDRVDETHGDTEAMRAIYAARFPAG